MEIKGDFGTNYEYCDVWPGSAQCEYTCFGWKFGRSVGRQPVCSGDPHKCEMAPTPSRAEGAMKWDFWNFNTAALLGTGVGGGEWYSLAAKQHGVAWRNATVVKAVNQRCQARALDELVQERGALCFGACPQPRNHSSACWIDCFFATVLGPKADTTLKPPGAQAGAIDVHELTTAWERGLSDCPACPEAGSCPWQPSVAVVHDMHDHEEDQEQDGLGRLGAATTVAAHMAPRRPSARAVHR